MLDIYHFKRRAANILFIRNTQQFRAEEEKSR